MTESYVLVADRGLERSPLFYRLRRFRYFRRLCFGARFSKATFLDSYSNESCRCF